MKTVEPVNVGERVSEVDPTPPDVSLLETPPVRCSGCWGQYPERRHVDFESHWEGPMFREGVMGEDGEISNTINVSIDDLVLCEDCLRAAAKLIGLVDPDEVAEYAEQLEKRADDLLERNRGLEEHNKQLKAAIASEPAAA